MDKGYHIPVLLKEAIEGLNIDPSGFYFDGTLGEAGHSYEIYKKLNSNGLLLSIDQDEKALNFVQEKYKEELKTGNWVVAKGNFNKIKSLVERFNRKLNGILLDIGISSRQIEVKGRGFSYLNDNDPLDMRMDNELAVSASDLLKVLSEKQLTQLFYEYGQERYSARIAKEIKMKEINTVKDLTSLIYKVVPAKALREDNHHPARRVFQALRIAVNDELGALKTALNDGFELLDKNGRFVVITFHSLEERIVKNFFNLKIDEGEIILRTQGASDEEIKLNNRAHSAKITVYKKN